MKRSGLYKAHAEALHAQLHDHANRWQYEVRLERQMQGVPCPETPEALQSTRSEIEGGDLGKHVGNEGSALCGLENKAALRFFRHMMSTKAADAARQDGPTQATGEGHVGASGECRTVPGQCELDPEAAPQAQQRVVCTAKTTQPQGTNEDESKSLE